ncbi:MAG: PhoH family protein, partial [Clostridiales bacterium]|nr:PhoH family protein [Clostridiales bacterium]
MSKQTERIVNADRIEDLIAVFGSFDENIKRIEQALNVQVINRGTDLRVCGDEEMADKAVRTIEGLLTLASKGEIIDEQRVRYLITLVNEGNDQQVAQMTKDVVCITAKGKPIKAKTVGQQRYMRAIQSNTVTIGVGPAGTGKTYLAVAAAVAAF